MKPSRGGPCAIVLGLDVSGYGIVRSLAHEHVPIVGLWRRADESGRSSRYCSAIQVAPDEDDQWIATILALAKRYDRPVLFPSSDRYAELLARHRGVLEPVTRFAWVDAATLETVLDKTRIGRVCAEAGLAVPRTCLPRGPDFTADAIAFSLPFLVKPRTTFRDALPGAAKVIVCRDTMEVRSLYRDAPRLVGTTVWQEIVEGEDDAIWQATAYAPWPGEVAAVACLRKVRQYPPGYGITSFGCTDWHAEVVDCATRLVRALSWTGIASIEFKRSARDGQFYFIEMNPRMPWYNALFSDAGINLAWLSWCHHTGAPRPEVRQADGVGWMSVASDMTSCWQRWRAGTLSASAWLGSLADADSFSWYERADPEPAIRAAVRLSGMGFRALLR